MTIRDRIDAAIASHQRLDTPEFQQSLLSADPEDRCYWQTQVQLDAAVAAWKHESHRVRPRRHMPARVAAAVTIAAAGVVVGWLGRAGELVPSVEVAPADMAAISHTRPVVDAIPATQDDTTLTASVESDQFAEAAATANRLVYALEPVGERVQVVVRFLVDAVPGSDVFAMQDAGSAI